MVREFCDRCLGEVTKAAAGVLEIKDAPDNDGYRVPRESHVLCVSCHDRLLEVIKEGGHV
jgi:hypothetical protein